MAHTRAVDDLQTIRARMEELRREGERGLCGDDCSIRAAITLSRQWRSDNHFYWPAAKRG